MSHPRDGNTDAGETLVLQPVESSLGGLFPLPGSLRRNAIRISVKVVSHIPAQAQLLRTGNGGIVRQCGILDHFPGSLAHLHGDIGSTGGLHGDIGLTGLITVIGRHFKRDGNFVVLVRAVRLGNPGRQRKRRTGRSGNGKVVGSGRLRSGNADRTHGDGCRSFRGGCHRCVGGFPAAAQQRHGKSQNGNQFSHINILLGLG